jgi:hypothetical protein
VANETLAELRNTVEVLEKVVTWLFCAFQC